MMTSFELWLNSTSHRSVKVTNIPVVSGKLDCSTPEPDIFGWVIGSLGVELIVCGPGHDGWSVLKTTCPSVKSFT